MNLENHGNTGNRHAARDPDAAPSFGVPGDRR